MIRSPIVNKEVRVAVAGTTHLSGRWKVKTRGTGGGGGMVTVSSKVTVKVVSSVNLILPSTLNDDEMIGTPSRITEVVSKKKTSENPGTPEQNIRRTKKDSKESN